MLIIGLKAFVLEAAFPQEQRKPRWHAVEESRLPPLLQVVRAIKKAPRGARTNSPVRFQRWAMVVSMSHARLALTAATSNRLLQPIRHAAAWWAVQGSNL